MPSEDQRRGLPHPSWSEFHFLLTLRQPGGAECQVRPGLREDRGGFPQHANARPPQQHLPIPEKISQRLPPRVKVKVHPLQGGAPDKHRASRHVEAQPEMAHQRNHRPTVAQIIARIIHHHQIRQQHVELRTPGKFGFHRLQGPGKILLVAIQVGDDVSLGLAESAVDRVIHPRVLLNKRLHPQVMRQPVERPVVGPRVLDNVLQGHTLIRDGGDAQPQPLAIAETRRDDGKARHQIKR